ncbi:MAG: PadR family transcriptional regulator [Bacteroidales bacterium]|nr:PadR family transcriptional regulator [Bacteroidales bacterium]MDY0217072.1 PadR family transcriptional regulator [Bacteroidales bacterium]
MKEDKNIRQFRKGVLELCILSVLSKQDAYVSDLIEVLKESKLIVVEGTMYPLLMRLKNDGYLTYQWVESKSGPPRKYYRISELGSEYLAQLEKSWDKMSKIVTEIRNKENQSIIS